MTQIAQLLGPWAWWIAGLVLFGLEIIVPGSVVVWFGVAAILVGAVSLLVDIPWQAEWAAFAVLSVISLYFGRRYFLTEQTEGEDAHLNDRAARYVGRRYVLADAIVQGDGRIRIADTVWRVTGPDLPAGTPVTVTAALGTVLEVAKAD
ncbi:MAG: NfeD family protein [Hyphomicrobiales bacterium]